jgi:hypothetical protein
MRDVGFSQQDEIDRLEINVQRRLNGRVRGFRLLVYPHGLILQGRVSTYPAKQLAQHTVMASTRLPILANEIEVECNFAAPAILVDA